MDRPQLPTERVVLHSIVSYNDIIGTTYALIYGQVLSPKVAAVEVIFDDGKIRRNEVTNGVFVLISPGANDSCKMQVLGKNDKILQRWRDVGNCS